MTNPNNWPDPNKPGVPPNAEQEGWHVVGNDAAWWRANSQEWVTHAVLHVCRADKLKRVTYGGRLYTEAEVAVREQAARRKEMGRALSVLLDEPVPESGLTFGGVMERDEKMIAAIRAAAKEARDE
jgi:hypothetical protein